MANYSLKALNQMDQDTFTAVLGEIFEHTPAIAHQTWTKRPFSSVADLHQAMVAVMYALPHQQQLNLIRAHPDLGSRAKMTQSSVQEQSGAGLDQLSAEDYQTFQSLNQTYQETFQFPFIIAVKEHTQDSILQAFQQRLTHDAAMEKQTALAEIAKIAQFRLYQLTDDENPPFVQS
ncbi:2-oxo-4-hydroxy-4-carboxy-5-ureidoimidazoline decarboxylase [Oscillatoria sp. CS-180]|uniref:2-oxo-4-hydroxy-4-carboxy-5-ureidoimidazoline decarboxylase n=1 Tax=Oscillatoria sp. CS-180 TaxID=3021720 RepID=UPI00233004A4|nr:2-oxo-4-hydroxy-4-carboxy-5-ureidoimidazoline decarboxylase [Oscillatoria sp. CS-180]MDB9528793.1 2-oxo-4-hydroxy-4-carboxy-5-ureidoimidazoline decarboxylase [Oscillatoria sp. CS-180]